MNLVLPSISQIYSSLLDLDADLKDERSLLSLFLGLADLLDIISVKFRSNKWNRLSFKFVYWVNKLTWLVAQRYALHGNVFLSVVTINKLHLCWNPLTTNFPLPQLCCYSNFEFITFRWWRVSFWFVLWMELFRTWIKGNMLRNFEIWIF